MPRLILIFGANNMLSMKCQALFSVEKHKKSKMLEQVSPYCLQYRLPKIIIRERSGSVEECSSRDRGIAGSSLTDITVLCP